MAWRKKLTDAMADGLRFASLGALLVGGVGVSVAFVYVLIKTCWFSVDYLDRTLFSEPW
ncbi:MAG: hypothetical protein MI923_03180 [Phycisphaerales bacterium]|nr:hypothetical protein [Phycisphaerales bacterium]